MSYSRLVDLETPADAMKELKKIMGVSPIAVLGIGAAGYFLTLELRRQYALSARRRRQREEAQPIISAASSRAASPEKPITEDEIYEIAAAMGIVLPDDHDLFDALAEALRRPLPPNWVLTRTMRGVRFFNEESLDVATCAPNMDQDIAAIRKELKRRHQPIQFTESPSPLRGPKEAGAAGWATATALLDFFVAKDKEGDLSE